MGLFRRRSMADGPNSKTRRRKNYICVEKEDFMSRRNLRYLRFIEGNDASDERRKLQAQPRQRERGSGRVN